jgi:hypothetical protein
MMNDNSYAKVEAGSADVSYCDRIQEIIVTTAEGRKERIERGIAYGLCVEAIRSGVLLKDLVKERIEPEAVDIEIRRWY